MRSFSHRKSIQNRRVPSFFLTSMTALHHGELEGQIAPLSSISWMCSLTSSIKGGAICQNCSLNGSLLVSLMKVFSGIGAPHFILVQGKDTMILHEKPSGSLCILL